MDLSLIRDSSAWSASQIQNYLADSEIPVRLACLDDQGQPLICSLWYLFDGDTIWCSTQANARIVQLLESEPQCGFEIAADGMPYRGVRGQGEASISDEYASGILADLIERYLHGKNRELADWLLSRSESEVTIGIEPRWLTSWDFSTRMS